MYQSQVAAVQWAWLPMTGVMKQRLETVAAVFISTFSPLRALRTTILASLAAGTQTSSR